MSILSQVTYSLNCLEVKRKKFLQAFGFECCIDDTELQVDALLEMSSAKMKARNRAAIGHLINTVKFMKQLGIPFRGHRYSGRLEPVCDIKGIDKSTGNFRAILQLHFMENYNLAEHLKEFPSNSTYLSLDLPNPSRLAKCPGILL